MLSLYLVEHVEFIQCVFVALYQRLDGAGPFATALTQVKPSSKGGNVLHPHVCLIHSNCVVMSDLFYYSKREFTQ